MVQPKASSLGDKETPPGDTTYRRARDPSHYLFEIQSFSEFLDSKVEKYETGRFKAGGYEWRMILCPKQRNADGYVSLYITLDLDSEKTKNALSSDGQIIVDVKLFSYDWIFENYRVIQGMEIPISEENPEWGFEKFLTLEEFQEEHNGYLHKDRCKFGAEVLVMPITPQRETLSMVRSPPDDATFTWKITDFGKLSEKVSSATFTVGDGKWKLDLFPKGDDQEYSSWLSLYLALADSETLPPKRKVYANFKLRALDQSQNNHFEKSAHHWFDGSESSWGFSTFLRHKELHDKSKGYLLNDTLIIQAEVVVVSVVGRSPAQI